MPTKTAEIVGEGKNAQRHRHEFDFEPQFIIDNPNR